MSEPSLVEWLSARLDEDEEVARDAETRQRWRAETHVGDYYNFGRVAAGEDGEVIATCGVEGMENGEATAAHIARWDPARVLAEVAAKRMLIAEHAEFFASPSFGKPDRAMGYCRRCCLIEDSDWDGPPTSPFPCTTVRLLALPYASHAGFREEWKP